MSKAHVKKDQTVVVISGADRGKSGRVLEVRPREQRVVVEGVNVRRHAVRRSRENPAGGMVEEEMPIHISNVMLQEKYDDRRSRNASADQKEKAE